MFSSFLWSILSDCLSFFMIKLLTVNRFFYINTTKKCSYRYKNFGMFFRWNYLQNCLANFSYIGRVETITQTMFCNIFLFKAKVSKKMPFNKILHNCSLMEPRSCQFFGDISFHYSFRHSFIHSISCFSSCGLEKFPAQFPADITGNLDVKKPW